MSSTHLSLHVHIVFGTKHQRALIRPEWRERFHAYLGGAARTLEVIPQAVGAWLITFICCLVFAPRIAWLM